MRRDSRDSGDCVSAALAKRRTPHAHDLHLPPSRAKGAKTVSPESPESPSNPQAKGSRVSRAAGLLARCRWRYSVPPDPRHEGPRFRRADGGRARRARVMPCNPATLVTSIQGYAGRDAIAQACIAHTLAPSHAQRHAGRPHVGHVYAPVRPRRVVRGEVGTAPNPTIGPPWAKRSASARVAGIPPGHRYFRAMSRGDGRGNGNH